MQHRPATSAAYPDMNAVASALLVASKRIARDASERDTATRDRALEEAEGWDQLAFSRVNAHYRRWWNLTDLGEVEKL